MVEADRRAVVHHPEPDQRLAFAIFRGIGIAVSLRLERGVARIERVDQGLYRQRRGRIRRGIRSSQIKLVQFLPDDIAAMLGVTIRELAIEPINPFEKCLFRGRNGLQDSIFVSGHSCLAGLIEKVKHNTVTSEVWIVSFANSATPLRSLRLKILTAKFANSAAKVAKRISFGWLGACFHVL